MHLVRYQFTSWPLVPGSNGFSLEWYNLLISRTIRSVGGTMYAPYDWLGTNPQICKTGPICGKPGLTCPRGILCEYALQKNVSDHDKVLTEFHEYHSRITHKHIRHFVTTFIVVCPGVPSRKNNVQNGVSLIQFVRAVAWLAIIRL